MTARTHTQAHSTPAHAVTHNVPPESIIQTANACFLTGFTVRAHSGQRIRRSFRQMRPTPNSSIQGCAVCTTPQPNTLACSSRSKAHTAERFQPTSKPLGTSTAIKYPIGTCIRQEHTSWEAILQCTVQVMVKLYVYFSNTQ